MASGQVSTSVPQTFDLPTDAPAHVRLALSHVGVQEWVMRNGEKYSNPTVQQWIEKAGGPKNANTMTTPWCAYFHDAMVELSGRSSLKSGLARSHVRWGVAVEDDDWKVGDTVVITRLVNGVDDHTSGHIFFLLWWDERHVYGVGGNQHDSVNIAAFRRETILAVRRYRSVAASRTIQKSIASAAAETGSQIADHTIDKGWIAHVDTAAELAENVRSPLEMLAEYKPWITGVLSTLAVLLALWAAYHRMMDHKEGKNT